MSDSAHPAPPPSTTVDRVQAGGDGTGPQDRELDDLQSAECGEGRVGDKVIDEPVQRNDDGSRPDALPSQTGASVESLIDEFHVLVYRYAFRLCGNQADAEDLTQQTFLAAQQNLNQLRDPSKARSWLLTICRNRFLKSCRRQQPLAISATDIEIEKIPAHAKPADEFDREKLQQVIQELPDEYRVVVMMFYFEQLSYREIAEQLDVKLGTVMSRLSRAKARLRSVLFPEQQLAEAPRTKAPNGT